MAEYVGAKRTMVDTFEILVRPADIGKGGGGVVILDEQASIAWRSLGGYVWVHVGPYRRGTICEDGAAPVAFEIVGIG